MDNGMQCVTTIGITRKPSWCVENWAILLQVIRYLVYHTWAEEKSCTAIHCCHTMHTNLYMNRKVKFMNWVSYPMAIIFVSCLIF